MPDAQKQETMMGKEQQSPPPVSDELTEENFDEEIQKRQEETRKRKEEILKQAQLILREYGGQAGNIPITHSYWGLMNEYRSQPPSPLPSTRITEPYRELPAESLDKAPRPEQIKRDTREQMAHYDKQHPDAMSVIQSEIRRINEARMTPEERERAEKERKETEKKADEAAKKQDEENKRLAEEQKKQEEQMRADAQKRATDEKDRQDALTKQQAERQAEMKRVENPQNNPDMKKAESWGPEPNTRP